MITKEIRDSQYNKTTKIARYLYSTSYSGKYIFTIAKKYDLHKDEMYKKFAITVGDIILGFYRIEDTVPLLQQELGLDPRTAALLGADVLDFLAPLSDPNWQPPVEERDEWDEESESSHRDDGATSEVGTVTPPIASTVDEPQYVSPQITNNQPYQVPFMPNDTMSPTTLTPEASVTGRAPQTSTYQPVGAPPAHVASQPVHAYAPVGAPTPPPPIPPRSEHQAPPLAANPALHTMASDMQQARQSPAPATMPTPTLNLDHEPSYQGQSQDALRQPLSTTPTYTRTPSPITPPPTHDPEPPRWSSTLK
jgi:hypothetical protein